MPKKTDVANKNSHSLLELMDLVKRDELVRLIKKVIDLQQNGSLDKLLAIIETLSKDKTVDKLYYKVNDISKKGTLTKLLEGNTLDKQLDAIIKMLQDGSLMKMLDLLMDIQKKGLIDELMNYVPKLMVLLEKIIDLEKKGVIKWEDINKLIDKIADLISSGTLDTLMDMIDIVPVALGALNSEPVRKLLTSNLPKLLELVQKLAEMNEKSMLNFEKLGNLMEKLFQLINDGTVDKLLEVLVLLSALLDALNDEMIKSVAEKLGKVLELIEPSKL
ncbi:MAG: hypothetical protein ACP5R3_02000 [Thermoplasmata archaeon]